MLFYNGDFDLNDAAANESKVPINFGGSYILETDLVYTDFIVPIGRSWTITSLFSDDQMVYGGTPTTATWQIRSGMSPAQGGTLVASGDTTATLSLLHTADQTNYLDAAYNVSAAVTGVTLPAGVYWMAIAADSLGYYGDQYYNETTSGANAVGLPTGLDGNTYLNNTLPAPGTQTYVLSALDYSAGITGTSALVPEPGSLSLLIGAVAGVSRLGRRPGRSTAE